MNEVSYDAPRPEAVRDLSGTLAAQQTANPAAAEVLARDFLTRVQRDIDEQVDLRVQQKLAASRVSRRQAIDPATDLPIAICSIVGAIPLTAIAGKVAELPGMALVWAGLVIINVAWSHRR